MSPCASNIPLKATRQIKLTLMASLLFSHLFKCYFQIHRLSFGNWRSVLQYMNLDAKLNLYLLGIGNTETDDVGREEMYGSDRHVCLFPLRRLFRRLWTCHNDLKSCMGYV